MGAPARRVRPLPAREESMDEQVFTMIRDRFRALDERLDDQDTALEKISESVKTLAQNMDGRVDALEQESDGRRTAARTHAERDQRFSKRTRAIWIIVTTLALIAATALSGAIAGWLA